MSCTFGESRQTGKKMDQTVARCSRVRYDGEEGWEDGDENGDDSKTTAATIRSMTTRKFVVVTCMLPLQQRSRKASPSPR